MTLGKSPSVPIALSRRLEVTAIATLWLLAIARQVRTRRLLGLIALFALPVVIAALARYYADPVGSKPGETEVILIFYMIPHALLPLSALLLASGMVQDEVEEQTLTYLLIRPLPRWSIYIAKLWATVLITAVVMALATLATFAVIHWGTEGFWDTEPIRAGKTIALFGLALLAYSALFGALGLLVRRALPLGVVYIIIFEDFLANIGFSLRRMTVVYYFRVLCERWLDLMRSEWSIDLTTAPSTAECVLTLATAGFVATVLAAVVFTAREFRVKTPEGS
jgi:ABC-2 type transport system permease protein